MSYQKITSFAVKDTMLDNNPLKVVRGKEFDDEFDAITTAMDSQESVIANLVTTPVGGVIMFAGPGTPAGFLLCDGIPQSRNTYTALFQAIGTTFGVGDGSTTFNVPAMVGRFPYGGVPGQLGGSADAVLPAHTHTATVAIQDPGHSHAVNTKASVQPQSGSSTPVWYGDAAGTTSAATTGITATAAVASAGTTATNGNLPPFIGMRFIIKY